MGLPLPAARRIQRRPTKDSVMSLLLRLLYHVGPAGLDAKAARPANPPGLRKAQQGLPVSEWNRCYDNIAGDITPLAGGKSPMGSEGDN